MIEKRNDYITWEAYFMGLALLSAQRSKDPKRQVGACIVSDNNRVLSIGYNGAPNGFPDDMIPWQKEGSFASTKFAYICHAELNAILNFHGDLRNSKLYVTYFPCNECAKAIIQAGIREIIYLEDKNCEETYVSKKLFDTCGVIYHSYIMSHRKIEIEI